MSVVTLDPKLDVVFKLLFADRRNKRLLVSLLTAVLQPAKPIVNVEVLNPILSKESVAEKGAILDVFAHIAGGQRANVEMQPATHPGFRGRSVLYLAKSHAEQLKRGQDYTLLVPTHSVFFLNFNEFGTPKYHSRFRLMELEERAVLSEDLTLHYIELRKLPGRAPDPGDPPVLKWAKFFAANTDQERELVAMTHPDINSAKQALERLSADPAAQQLAREREEAAWNLQYMLRSEREAAEARGGKRHPEGSHGPLRSLRRRADR